MKADDPMPVSASFQLAHYLGYFIHQAGGSVTIPIESMKSALSGKTIKKESNQDGTITISLVTVPE